VSPTWNFIILSSATLLKVVADSTRNTMTLQAAPAGNYDALAFIRRAVTQLKEQTKHLHKEAYAAQGDALNHLLESLHKCEEQVRHRHTAPIAKPVLERWDYGVFFNELERCKVFESNEKTKIPAVGTYDNTKRSLTQMFERIEHQ